MPTDRRDRNPVFDPLAIIHALNEHLTQFGRALAELGIGAIAARTPQAKGRVQRVWGTRQERLVTALRIAGRPISTPPTRCWPASSRLYPPLRGAAP